MTPSNKDAQDSRKASFTPAVRGRTRKRSKPSGNGPGKKPPFALVGIGASAGGLEALETLFGAMPDECPRMAFVVVSHLDPKHTSILPELIQKHTTMPVHQVEDGMQIEPCHIYVIPPDRELELLNGALGLKRVETTIGPRAPINRFFRSMAEHRGETSVAIVLSGMGTDGTTGIQALKGELGMVMVQEPDSAKYNAMPKSAIATGLADFVLPPAEMPAYLTEYVDRLLSGETVPAERVSSEALKKIHTLLRTRTGHDFSHYKISTVQRRIARRMNVHGIESLSEYVGFLRKNPQENEALIRELLIGVTRFFRDTNAFTSLEENGLPALFDGKPDGYVLRGWVAGCSTGEEAYSVAILLQEYIERHQLNVSIQLFATDLDESAIENARAGLYFGDIAKDVSARRLKRYFKRENDGYQIVSQIREVIIFAKQSVIKDPPFTKLDLICCRNLIIYLNGPIQKKLLPLFHHSLKPNGILFLGSSESINPFGPLFTTLDSKWKIFQKKPGLLSVLQPMDFPLTTPRYETERPLIARPTDIAQLTERTLLDYYTPAAVVVDARGDIRYIHGRIAKFLQLPQGAVRNFNAIEMALEGLKLFLITTLRNLTPDFKTVRKLVQVGPPDQSVDARVTVSPISQTEDNGLYIVLFEEIFETEKNRNPPEPGSAPGNRETEPMSVLEKELKNIRERLHTTVEELETSNEELRSANEEYQSTNEELQSANEELNSSKEELQSLNEELETVNAELQGKVRQVEKAYDEMRNMLNSLEIPIIFLDHNLRIRRFSANATHIVELIESDVGRPLSQLASKIAGMDLEKEAQKVLAGVSHVEKEVQTQSGEWYLIRILPYHTVEQKPEGVVLTFMGTQRLMDASERFQQAQAAKQFAEGIIETVREPLLVLDSDLQVMSANESYYRTFHVAERQVEGHALFDLGAGQWDMPELRQLLEEVLPNRQSFEGFEMRSDFPRIGPRKLILNARRIHEHGVARDRILLAIEDVTERNSGDGAGKET